MELGNTGTYTHVPNRAYTVSTRETLSHCHKPEKVGEKTLEAKLRKAVEARGGMALKLLSQFHRGLPDRLILMPGGHTYFAEIKTTGKKPTELQLRCHDQLRALGFDVFIVDSKDTLLEALDTIGFDQDADAFKRLM